MKKLTLLLILLIGSLSYGQVILYQHAPDRQKIAFDSITGDISLQNSPSINISSKENRANKTTDLSSPNNTTYPTTQAVANAIAEVEVGSGVTSQYMDSDKTLEQSDFGKYIYTDESIELTIDNTPAVSSKIGLKVIDIDSTITVKPSSGVVFSGDGQDISEGFIVDSLNLATVFKLASNLYSVDGVYKPYVPPSNLYTLLNAANPDNEVNATTGITGVTDWMPESVSSDPTPQNGSYAVKLVSGSAGENVSNINLTGLEIGKTYKVGIWVYRISSLGLGGMVIEMTIVSGWANNRTLANINSSVAPGSWNYYEITEEAASTTPSIIVRTGGATSTGAALSYDNITIEEVE